jgi:hypothetical protein
MKQSLEQLETSTDTAAAVAHGAKSGGDGSQVNGNGGGDGRGSHGGRSGDGSDGDTCDGDDSQLMN